VDDVEKAEYERLCAEYDQRKMVYDTRQNQLYRRQMGVMEKQIAMFTAAIEAENIETAEKALEKAKAVKAELETIPGADPALMQEGSKLAARLPDMEWRLKNAVKAIGNYRRARTQLLDSRTFPDFSSNLELFSLHVPAVRAEFRNDIKKYKDGELAVANSAYEENLENIPVFKEDVRTLNSIVNARKQLQRELRQVLARELTKRTAGNLKMIVLGNPYGDMCTLLFDRAQQKVNIGSKRQVELHCMTDLSGAYENLIITIGVTIFEVGDEARKTKLNTTYLLDDVCLRLSKSSCTRIDICADNIKLGLRHALVEHLQAFVELVVTEDCHVVVKFVHQLNNRLSALGCHINIGVTGNTVACIDKDYLGSICGTHSLNIGGQQRELGNLAVNIVSRNKNEGLLCPARA
jgi:hypothetical protein